eukprot:6172859-Pleurochrysis_carterae.AAC.5
MHALSKAIGCARDVRRRHAARPIALARSGRTVAGVSTCFLQLASFTGSPIDPFPSPCRQFEHSHVKGRNEAATNGKRVDGRSQGSTGQVGHSERGVEESRALDMIRRSWGWGHPPCSDRRERLRALKG